MLNRILIDPRVFAAEQESIRGKVALSDLDKRVQSDDFAELSAEIAYSLQGGTDKWQRPFVALSVSGVLLLRCQRCMQPVEFLLDETATVVLFLDEQELDEAMLVDDELDGMLLEDELDVLSLVEDQILMALPVSPKHEHCSHTDLTASPQGKTNPFAVLAGLKKTD